MTKDEINALPVGREIDSLVAEQIMGWKLPQDNVPAWMHKTEEGWVWVGFWPDTPSIEYEWSFELLGTMVFTPSADWDAAGKVMDAHLKPNWSKCNPFIEKTPNGYTASFDGINYGNAPTAPHAICIAALLTNLDHPQAFWKPQQ